MFKTTHPLYMGWAMMIFRCTFPGASRYDRYGARGIKVCDRWMNSFQAFVDDMGPRPPGMSLDRIDNDGPYSPENCRWATRSQQARNKQNSRFAVIDGVKYHLSELSEKYGIDVRTLAYRLKQKWPQDRLLNPAIQYNNSASQKKAVAIHSAMKKAQKKCKRGHQLKGDNLYVHEGRRSCRTCRRAHDRFQEHGRIGKMEDYL